MTLPQSYFQNDDVIFLARDLVGKLLCTEIGGVRSCGMITETEAYRSWGDRACHAHGNRRTKRTETMFLPGGHAYVYLCYGIHHLFNIVTHREGTPEAVLIRSVEPVEGMEIMAARRGKAPSDKTLTSGPGNMSMALGISIAFNSIALCGPEIWLEEYRSFNTDAVISTTRVGVDYAGEDALLPWRFYIDESTFVSRR